MIVFQVVYAFTCVKTWRNPQWYPIGINTRTFALISCETDKQQQVNVIAHVPASANLDDIL